MTGKRAMLAIVAGVALWSAQTSAATTDDYDLETTQDLVDLCSVDMADPMHDNAMHFCYGYFAGAMHFHRGLTRGPDVNPMVCPDEQVTRTETVDVFVAWAKANPQHLEETPIQGVMLSLFMSFATQPHDSHGIGKLKRSAGNDVVQRFDQPNALIN